MNKIENKDIPKPRGYEKPQFNNKYDVRRITMQLPDEKGVENTTEVISYLGTGFDKVHDALADDNKISVAEALAIAVALVPGAMGFIKAIPEIPSELIFDALSEEDIANIATALNEVKNIKGDTRDATKELLPIVFGLKDWYFKWFVGNA